MDVSPWGLLRNYVPEIPQLLKTIFQAGIGQSPNSAHQDWLTEIIVQFARPILRTPASLLRSQDFFNRDFGVWGNKWISHYTVPAPCNFKDSGNISVTQSHDALSIEEAIAFSIKSLALHPSETSCPIDDFNPSGVEVEWSGHRRGTRPWSRLPSGLSHQDIYNQMVSECPQGEDSPVILFAHGGAFCLMDPANHRSTITRLSKMTGARGVSVRYRLSPQAIFPSALMDMFLTYLALLHPPPGSFHQPVQGNKIVLAGDSSGGNLVTALQVLLSTLVLHGKTKIRVPWSDDGDESLITIPNPPTAALSIVSPWLDITRSLPSCTLNSQYDFIAPPEPLKASLMSTSPMFPADDIWPAKPVRTETYCDAIMCAHPLVTPLTTPKEVLAQFPSVYACTGWEGMTDETEVFLRRVAEAQLAAKRLNEQSHSIDSQITEKSLVHKEIFFDGYIGMPHVFASFEYNAAGVAANQNRGQHIENAIAGVKLNTSSGDRLQATDTTAHANWTNVKTGKTTTIPMAELGMTSDFSGYVRKDPLTDEFVLTRVEEGRIFRVELEKRLREQESRAQ